ncbi:hypothetical protein [Pseudaestuariivita rosea]|uniref:hypothetical protein n=1 Tax=Pseudaestuariivita rosea TaxID=2763263 RepID=UPI001ABAD768|nr:hypothetical protein [Pseudaestuariivita rosea]
MSRYAWRGGDAQKTLGKPCIPEKPELYAARQSGDNSRSEQIWAGSVITGPYCFGKSVLTKGTLKTGGDNRSARKM